MSNFEKQYKNIEQELTEKLAKSALWYLVPAGQERRKNTTSEVVGVLKAESGLVYHVKDFQEFFKQNPFIGIWCNGKKQNAVLQADTKLIWSNSAARKEVDLNESKKILSKINWLNFSGWVLPEKEQLFKFATSPGNPYRVGQEFRLKCSDGSGVCSWLCSEGRVDVDKGYWGAGSGAGFIFAVLDSFVKAKSEQILNILLEHDWQFKSFDGKTSLAPVLVNLEQPLEALTQLGFDLLPVAEQVDVQPNMLLDEFCLYHASDAEEKADVQPSILFEEFYLYHASDAEEKADVQPIRLSAFPSFAALAELDYRACRLPKMDANRLSDPERGLWELWGSGKAFLRNYQLEARDPWLDVQNRAVAIDFGTSSTVVATESLHGDSELLRIGVRDFYQERKPHHYENPTVLEFLDFCSFTQAWKEKAYRPDLDWDWVHASHEAQASFRDNPGDTEILASILPRLKQWALRDEKHQRVRLTGRKGEEMELLPHVERNPIRGEALKVSEADSLDPVELYAWYLGMTINWRERGIFLKYYLSFPVKYPLEVKNRILASFRRGLQRSFPQTLIDHYPQVLQQFEVQDLASEPAAYAAAALPFLGVKPTDEGIPYAVFDFGGGTSDFDFGIWRWATDEEDAQGYESVFEHYASSGDNYLGGENLLEHLVYATFKHNLSVLREKKIQFTKPMDASGFPGSEPFLAPTQAAQTNVVMLSAKLRPFLESKEPILDAQLKLDLINSQGTKVTCELLLNSAELDELLQQKIQRGLLSFLHELKKVLSDFPENQPIQLLLAGNGSRSRHIGALFENGEVIWKKLCEEVFGEDVPGINIHKPLPVDMDNPYAPTSKTGVALGLLQIVPGKNIKLTNRLQKENDGQAPFAWYVGRLRRDQLEPALDPESSYNQWKEIGPIQQGVFYLYYSNSPRTALSLKKGDPELKMQRLDLYEAAEGSKLYARAAAPNQIELTCATKQPETTEVVIKSLVLE